MPPKKSAAVPAEPPAESKTGAAAPRKPATHPSTAIMVKEALKALDSRKGVSSIAIQNYIKQKYSSVDELRLKNFVRKALKKGIETGTFVRPAKSSVTTGATGKFRLALVVKETKQKSENIDPNVQKKPKAAKEDPKKVPKAGATKKKDAAKEQVESQEDSTPPKKSKTEKGNGPSKVAKAKKPRSKKSVETEEGNGASDSAKPKATKVAKTETASQSKVANVDGDAPTTKGRGRKKTAA